MTKLLVVGQGIAGTVLAHTLLQAGAAVTVADKHTPNSASRVAAGVCNPITGRFWHKTWLADTIFPFARAFYTQLGAALGAPFFSDVPIWWLLKTPFEENNWSARSLDPSFSAYCAPSVAAPDWLQTQTQFRIGETQGAFRVHLSALLPAYRSYLDSRNALMELEIPLTTEAELEVYRKQNGFDAIILCQGAFSSFPLVEQMIIPNVGQAFRTPLTHFPQTAIVKRGVTVVPMGADFWIGATYKKPTDVIDLEQDIDLLQQKLQQWWPEKIAPPTPVSAIRPTISDRRPIMGQLSPENPIFVFNGMGSKGCSLAPYFAKVFADYLLHQKPLPIEVDLNRFL